MDRATPDLQELRIDRTRGRRGGRGLGLLLLFALAAGAWFGWQRFGPAADPRPEVEVGRVRRIGGFEAQEGVSANGYVVARRQAALSTDIQGRLVELPVEEGHRVEEGDLIARLDTRQLEANLARLEAEVRRGQAEIERARAAALLARKDYARIEPLVRQGDQPESALDAARATLDQAEATVRSLEASLDATRAAREEVEVMIRKSSIFAPFAGVVTRKNAEVGEVVSAISAAGPNARGAVVTLVDFDTLEVQVELAQTSLAAVRTGAPALIFLDAWPEDAYRGRVRQIWPTADRQKATVELRVEFLERDERILPEMGVRVVFQDEERPPAPPRVLLPAAALVPGPRPHVFVYRAGTVRLQEVQVEEAPEPGLLEVREGLRGGELVVLKPSAELDDGVAVRRREET